MKLCVLIGRLLVGVALIGSISWGVIIDAWAGPAPPLTYLQVYAARSEKCPQWEYFSRNQSSSTKDHGGSWMEIVTEELGYANPYSRYAEMNRVGFSLIKRTAIHIDGDNIVDGWRFYWKNSGQQSGVFKYKATSINYPYNTMYDAIYIK